MPMSLHDLQGVAHAEGDAFEQRADHGVAGGARGQADPAAAGAGVGVGAALAGEIGQEEQPLAAGRGLFGLGDEQLVGVDALCFLA